jgi:hypothetical protein
VGHRDTVEDLVRKGRDLEEIVLARAVRRHVERRVWCMAEKPRWRIRRIPRVGSIVDLRQTLDAPSRARPALHSRPCGWPLISGR